MHPEADAEVRDLALACHAAGEDLPLPASGAEASGNEHAVDLLELAHRLLVGHVLGVHPADANPRAVMDACVLQRLVHGEVRVVELHVLADERYLDLLLEVAAALRQLAPLPELGGAGLEVELLADERIEALCLQVLRHHVDVGHVGRADDRTRVDVCEERDLLAEIGGERLGRAADDDVGVDTDPAELVHRVLRRLRLQLSRGRDERHERHVQVQDVLVADLPPELADRLEERERLDVADGPSDLGDDHVGRHDLLRAPDAGLDLVRDVRNDLDGRAEELALALLAKDRCPRSRRPYGSRFGRGSRR